MLYLFQFPNKRKKGLQEPHIRKCKFKPDNKQVTLEMSIDTECSNFDAGNLPSSNCLALLIY